MVAFLRGDEEEEEECAQKKEWKGLENVNANNSFRCKTFSEKK